MCGGSGAVGSHCRGLAFGIGQSWPWALSTHVGGRPAGGRAGLELGWVERGTASRQPGKGARPVLGEGIGFDPEGAFSRPFIQQARQIWGRSPRVDG